MNRAPQPAVEPVIRNRRRRAASAPPQRRNGTKRLASSAPSRFTPAKPVRPRAPRQTRRQPAPDWWPKFRESLRPGLEQDTQLMPWVIAESVCDEVSRFLGEPLPDRYVAWLDAKAERCYARHTHFRKLMRGRGNAPRDWLYAFMRHWLASFLDLERPDLYQCLPESFELGQRLPPGIHPRIRRKGFVPTLLPQPRDWDAGRVLRHRRWTWLPQA